MRIIGAVVLVSCSLIGCTGDFTNARIDARYERGLENCRLLDLGESWCVNKMEANRQYDKSYRFSMRRFFGEGGGKVTQPTQVYILNP